MANGGALRKDLREILCAFENLDPPPDRQKAVSPRLLEDMRELATKLGPLHEHAADLITGAFFFAMRGCEFCLTDRTEAGRTKLLELGDVTFRDHQKRVIPKTSADLEERAHYVTIRFVFQKNRVRMDRRTQGRSGKKLCPVRSWARACRRVLTTTRNPSSKTRVCEVGNGKGQQTHVTSERVKRLLRLTCYRYGKERGYGIEEHELGTRSIRSGAAMALFLMDHLVKKIMILGRWSSDAFLVYIRPQVLEWTNIMAEDMASSGDFRDLGRKRRPSRTTKRSGGPRGIMPSFHLSH